MFVKADKSHFPLALVFSFPLLAQPEGLWLTVSDTSIHGPVLLWPHQSGGEERQQKRKGKGKKKEGWRGRREGAGIAIASPEAYPQMAGYFPMRSHIPKAPLAPNRARADKAFITLYLNFVPK